MTPDCRSSERYRGTCLAAHDANGEFVWVIYRIDCGCGTPTAWEGCVEVGKPPSAFADAYREMVRRCDELNSTHLAAA